VTRPYSHSAADTQSRYRSLDELDVERSLDPIARLRIELVEAGVLTEARPTRSAAASADVADAARAALAAPRPDPPPSATTSCGSRR
jgi:TPP-dependent pyruvate/acetoin dehydrogenase alpha subunit